MPLLARPRILVFAGSVRSGALSQKVADIAAKEIALLDAEVTKISLIDYPLPIYNGDFEKGASAENHPESTGFFSRVRDFFGG
ncbi:MAG: NAD(P)H-dependent oxidoreductase, partial [Rhizobiales bacterium]|nr:NAD(P)H-dependent oxidoreductase [Hyphomicrobiales bacterium]